MVRRITLLTASLAVAALGLAACGGDSGGAASGGSAAAVTPTGPVVPATLVGMQVEGAEVEAWPSAPFGALRLWDNGTAWSQIELSKGEFKWDNLDGVLANAKSKGMTDVLMVLGTTPEWRRRRRPTRRRSTRRPPVRTAPRRT